MTRPLDGFHLLADELNAAAVKDILAWRDHPELSRLLTKLLSHTSRKPFLDSFAEAMVARHLLSSKCEVRFEIPTPQGKRCDFEVVHGSQSFYLHVKRVETDLPGHSPKQMRAISSRLRSLERITRPYIVQVRWNERITAEQMRSLVKQTAGFIEQARIGDELVAKDQTGQPIGGARIIAPSQSDHVSVTLSLRGGAIDQSERFRKMMERANQQFMPRAINVILICSDHIDDVVECENALLGTHIERWDAFPPRGKRVAHGRAEDGFWHAGRFADSHVAGWFQFSPDERSLHSRLWVREDTLNDAPTIGLLRRLFDAKSR